MTKSNSDKTHHHSLRLVEVGPRDGLQNESRLIALAQKIEFVDALLASGLQEIELTSLVRPDKIPQLADGQDLLKHYQGSSHWGKFWVLVPNLKGMEIALKLGVKKMALFTSPSELFNQRNINASVAEGMQRIREIIETNQKLNPSERMEVRVYLSMVFGCPYEGQVPFAKTFALMDQLQAMGVKDMEMGDTIGVATPWDVGDFLTQLRARHFDFSQLGMHFHDTRGTAIANICASYQAGVRTFSSSAGGLGGCPYAVGSMGNVATEEVIYVLKQGLLLDGEKIAQAAWKLSSSLSAEATGRLSKLARYYQSKMKQAKGR